MEEHRLEEMFTVSVDGAGVKIEKSVPAGVARDVINVLMGGPPASIGSYPAATLGIGGSVASTGFTTGSPASVAGPVGGRRISLREYLDESQASRNPDKITAIAEYLYVHESAELFTKDDIKGRFRSAGEAPPANFPRDFAWAVKNGWIAEEVKSPGSFYVTQKGRQAIANKFSDEVKKATAKSTRRRSRKGGNGFAEEDKE